MNTYDCAICAKGTVLKARHHGHVEKVAVPLLALTVVAETRVALPTCASGPAVC